MRLYIVLFLHQTTTFAHTAHKRFGCISYYSYIKPQQAFRLGLLAQRCISYYSYIKPQQAFRLGLLAQRCISYYSYIKPQRIWSRAACRKVVYRTIPTSNHNTIAKLAYKLALYIVLFLHQTTTYLWGEKNWPRCISYYSYIKPQPNASPAECPPVVYRTIPTSNHNL